MISENDWRLQGQEKYMSNVELLHIPYEIYREGWDHEHCTFCGEKFSLCQDRLNFGYCTLDKYNWICEVCFNDFKEMFNWNVKEQAI